MTALEIKEVCINATAGYMIDEGMWYEPFTGNKGDLFRTCQREHGHCVSKVYIDLPQADGTPTKTQHVGWCFEKSVAYDDCPERYKQEVWVEWRTAQPMPM